MRTILTRAEGKRRGPPRLDVPQQTAGSQLPDARAAARASRRGSPRQPRGGGERLGYALQLAYDGRRFSGFARQPGQRTVEGVLQAVLARLVPEFDPAPQPASPGEGVAERRSPGLAVAARTDAGVHARAQVVSFRVRRKLDLWALRDALERALPRDLRIQALAAVGPSFHARNSCLERTYVYRMRRGDKPLGREGHYQWILPSQPHDWEAARRFLAAQAGRQDRAAFTTRPPAPKITELSQAELRVDRAGRITAVFRGDGFTRHLIRNWMAVALALAQGRRLARWGPHGFRGRPAPAVGLCLWEVRYRRDPFATI